MNRCGSCGQVVQPALNFTGIPDPAAVEPARKNNPNHEDLRAKAAEWIAENPRVYEVFETIALRMQAEGKRFGVGLLAEHVRWNPTIRAQYGEDFKINNNHRAYIARKLVADHPELEGVLRFRETRY